MKNIICKIFGQKTNRSLVIFNQIKHPSQTKALIQCERCKIILDKEVEDNKANCKYYYQP